jgi:hypothetical protein
MKITSRNYSEPDPESVVNFLSLSTVPSMDESYTSSIAAQPRRPFSTTSSVYAEHTLSNPDNEQVIYW